MTPSTLINLIILINFVAMASATSTNITYTNQPTYYIIIKETIEPYGDFNEYLRVKEVEMVYYNINNYTCVNTDDNIGIYKIINIIINDYGLISFVLFLVCSNFIINCIISTIKFYVFRFIYSQFNNYIKKLEEEADAEEKTKPEPVVEPVAQPVYEIPNVNIKEEVIVDDEDSDDNCTIYKTHKIELTVFDIDEIKIDDVIEPGECYLEVLDQILYTHNYKTIKFTNLTYRDLVKLLTTTFLKLPTNHITMDSINKNKNLDGVPIISINY